MHTPTDVNHVSRRLSGSSDTSTHDERKLEPDVLAFGYDITDTDLLAIHGDMPRTKELIAKCGLGAMTVLRDMIITDCNAALARLFGDTWLAGSVRLRHTCSSQVVFVRFIVCVYCVLLGRKRCKANLRGLLC